MDENQNIEKLTDTEIEKTDIENTINEPQPVQTYKNEHRSKNKKKLLIILLITIALLIAAGTGAYYILNKDEKNGSKVSDKSKVVEKEKVASFTPQNAIDAVKAKIELKYPQVLPEDSELSGDQIYYKVSDIAPYWKVPGVKFYANYEGMGASGLEIYTAYDPADYNKVRGTEIINAIQESLTEKGFVESTDNAYSQEYSARTAFVKGDVLCLTSSLDESSLYNPPYAISCGNISKYTSELDIYKESKPFADAYLLINKSMPEGSILSFSSERVSATRGYKTANVTMSSAISSVGGAIALYYKKDGGDWIFFKATQDSLMCEDYNTIDLKSAFKYEPCMQKDATDNYVESTVQ